MSTEITFATFNDYRNRFDLSTWVVTLISRPEDSVVWNIGLHSIAVGTFWILRHSLTHAYIIWQWYACLIRIKVLLLPISRLQFESNALLFIDDVKHVTIGWFEDEWSYCLYEMNRVINHSDSVCGCLATVPTTYPNIATKYRIQYNIHLRAWSIDWCFTPLSLNSPRSFHLTSHYWSFLNLNNRK